MTVEEVHNTFCDHLNGCSGHGKCMSPGPDQEEYCLCEKTFNGETCSIPMLDSNIENVKMDHYGDEKKLSSEVGQSESQNTRDDAYIGDVIQQKSFDNQQTDKAQYSLNYPSSLDRLDSKYKPLNMDHYGDEKKLSSEVGQSESQNTRDDAYIGDVIQQKSFDNQQTDKAQYSLNYPSSLDRLDSKYKPLNMDHYGDEKKLSSEVGQSEYLNTRNYVHKQYSDGHQIDETDAHPLNISRKIVRMNSNRTIPQNHSGDASHHAYASDKKHWPGRPLKNTPKESTNEDWKNFATIRHYYRTKERQRQRERKYDKPNSTREHIKNSDNSPKDRGQSQDLHQNNATTNDKLIGEGAFNQRNSTNVYMQDSGPSTLVVVIAIVLPIAAVVGVVIIGWLLYEKLFNKGKKSNTDTAENPEYEENRVEDRERDSPSENEDLIRF